MKPGLSYHMAFSMVTAVREIKDAKVKGKQQDLVMQGGKFLPNEEALNGIANMQKRGFKVLPMCDNYDAEGFCRGHKE